MEGMFLTADGWHSNGYGHYRKGDLHVWAVAAGLFQASYRPPTGYGLVDGTIYGGLTGATEAKAAAERLRTQTQRSDHAQ